MNMPNEYSPWGLLYENRLEFINKSIDEFIADIDNKKLLENIEVAENTNKINIYNFLIKKLKNNKDYKDINIEKKLSSLQCKLDENERKFIRELNIQDELSEKIKRLINEKIKYKDKVDYEINNFIDGLERLLNHFDNTMDRIKEKGLNNIIDRKGLKIVEILQCFKKNLCIYFMKVLVNFKNYSCEFNLEHVMEKEINYRLEKVESNFAKYLFKQYITEIEWECMIKSAKKYSKDYIKICKIYAEESSLIIEGELDSRIEILNNLMKKSIKKIEEIKKQRFSMEKTLKEIKYKSKELTGSKECELEKYINMFEELVKENYINEYNKVVTLINNKNTLENDISIYYEYLYLITSEMEKVEGDLYG